MAYNHPYRGRPSREALELIATFAAFGIALNRDQQHACAVICRNARTVKRTIEASCNGHPHADRRHATSDEQAEWWATVEKQGDYASERIYTAAKQLPNVLSVEIGGDPRGATVKLIMSDPTQTDDMGREGICVPGS